MNFQIYEEKPFFFGGEGAGRGVMGMGVIGARVSDFLTQRIQI